MLNILFLSNVMSKASHKKLCSERTRQRIEPSQKFFDLAVRGMSHNDDVKLHCISVMPVYHAIYKKLIIKTRTEKADDNLSYEYIGFVNYPLFKQISIYLNVGVKIKRWIKRHKDEEKIIVVDPMLVEVTHKALAIAKRYGVKIVSFVTDVPSLTFSASGRLKFLKKIYLNMSDKDISKFDAHILLTDQMNSLFNKENKKNLLIESMVPIQESKEPEAEKEEGFVIMYAGKLHEKFGAKNLADAMNYIDDERVKMWIYGDGDSVDYIINKSKTDPRIVYKGVVPVEEVEKTIRRVSLLVNPRPCDNEFTKYSFPSKTVEYMMSGTPFASTRLPGIPDEYFNYIMPVEDYSAKGIAETVNHILNLSEKELKKKAEEAKGFVSREKNNIRQGEKIVDFLKEIVCPNKQ